MLLCLMNIVELFTVVRCRGNDVQTQTCIHQSLESLASAVQLCLGEARGIGLRQSMPLTPYILVYRSLISSLVKGESVDVPNILSIWAR